MKNGKIYLFAVFLISGILCAQTPSFNYQKLGNEEGLYNPNIFSILQHPNGLIYLTTQNGIYTYDGYTFHKLSIDSLRSNALQNIAFKNNSEMYISIRGEGVAEYNLDTKKYTPASGLKFKNNSDQFIVNGNVACLLNPGVEIMTLDLSKGTVCKDEKRQAGANTSLAHCILKTQEGKILIGRSDGLYELDGFAQKKIAYLKNTPVFSLSQTPDGKLVLGTSSGILIANGTSIEKEIIPKFKSKAYTFLPDGGRSIEKVIADKYGRIWFSPSPGDNLYLYQNNTVYDVFEALDIQPALIKCMFKDTGENIWIGTFSEGAYYIQNPSFSSLNFTLNQNVLNVNSVYLKNNLLVAGTNNGLFGLHLSTGQTKILSKPDEFLKEPIGSIAEADHLIFYSKRNEMDLSVSNFMDSRFSYSFKPVFASLVYPLENNTMVVADRFANILLADQKSSKTLDTLISFPFYQISVNALLKKNDSLIIATSSGLFIYDFKTKKYNQLVRADLNYNINDVTIINGELFAAHEAGITNVNKKELIQKLGPLSLNSVKKIKSFDNKIWLATLDGVYVCDQNWQPIKKINKTEGLLSNSISDLAFNGETICIATTKGVAVANINQLLGQSSKLNPVTINSVKTRDDTISFTGNAVNLNSSQDEIFVGFYSPVFNPNRQYYRFRVDEGPWVEFYQNALQTSISAGGKHKLEISVSVDNIVWSDNTVLNINKEAKLKESSWIYWLITLAGMALISVISYFIIRRVKANAIKRLQEERQVNLLKHQAMNALLSPHFIFNSLTSIQNYINTNNSLKASEYLAKFSRLIRMIIEKAAQSEITLNDELARLSYYLELEKERFKNKFDFTITVDEQLDRAEIKIPNMIIQPHVENCIIHGILPKLEHGSLFINFKKTGNNKLLITIEDDGIGLIKAREHAKTGHKSLGTSTIKSILEINSKLSGKEQHVTMVDKSTLTPPGQGTLITIEIEL